ncbi:O-antigen ligase family protein [Demequina zhanjiangensis]|uniref:O-Antigen ligase n=1 Tax=Demequina zhanjiangensis TaxID=3051659 RepID=A0ABT8FYN4_9MICO|nr:hypothetical protein [Demequina sp. SYSU T00b26]MDN4472018.1 hypothetical protein [Demequina sp. SYSU T00b26]
MHPANLMLVGAAFALLFRPSGSLLLVARIAPILALALSVIGGIGFVTTVMLAGASEILAYVTTFILTLVLGALVAGGHATGRLELGYLARLWIAIAVAEAALIGAQAVASRALVWESARLRNQSWFVTSHVDRPFGTFDSPIEAAAILAMALPLIPVIERSWVRYFSLAAILSGIFLTQSRSVAGISLVAVAYLAFIGLRSVAARVSVLVVSIISVLYLATSTTAGLVSRFEAGADDSLAVRGEAWQYFVENWQEYLVVGAGYRLGSGTKGVTLESSLENAYISLAFDIGVASVALLLVVQAYILWRPLIVPSLHRHFAVSSVAGIASGMAFSAFANPSAFGPFLWAAIGASFMGCLLPGAFAVESRCGADASSRVVRGRRRVTSSGYRVRRDGRNA